MKIFKYSLLGIFTTSIFAELFVRYRGNNASYYEDINSGALTNINYANDIYVNFDQVVFSSPIYFFLSFLPFNFNNDLLGFFIFSVFGLIGVYFLFQIISEIVKDEAFLSRLLILLSLISINYAFIEMVQTSPISTSLKPTLITQSFLYVLIYLCIKKNFALGSIICGLMIL